MCVAIILCALVLAVALAGCKKEKKAELVSSVELNKTELTLAPEQSETLLATVVPTDALDKSIAWSSSDDKIATVDASGKVTAVAVGVATITAKAKDASGKKAECKVTVKAVEVLLTKGETTINVVGTWDLASVQEKKSDGSFGEISGDDAVAALVKGLFQAFEFTNVAQEDKYKGVAFVGEDKTNPSTQDVFYSINGGVVFVNFELMEKQITLKLDVLSLTDGAIEGEALVDLSAMGFGSSTVKIKLARR